MVNIVLRPMHTLFPPLYVEKDANAPSADVDDNVLSQELKDNFDAVRAALRSQRTMSESAVDKDVLPGITRKRKSPSLDNGRHIAVRTAIAVEDEISRLRSGIEELEALLSATDSDTVDDLGGVAFPSLPPVVPDEPEQDMDEEDGEFDSTGKKSAVRG